MNKKFKLEEAIPLMREGREFNFINIVGERLNCKKLLGYDLYSMIDLEFELIPNHIKSLDELKDLDKAIFNGEPVHKVVSFGWIYSNRDNVGLVPNDRFLNIENWSYADE